VATRKLFKVYKPAVESQGANFPPSFVPGYGTNGLYSSGPVCVAALPGRAEAVQLAALLLRDQTVSAVWVAEEEVFEPDPIAPA